MMWQDVANLIYVSATQNPNGFDIETEEKIEVFVNLKSVTRTEFYSAMQNQLKPSIVFETRIEDYESTKHVINGKAVYAQKIEYDGAKYDIIRTYSKDSSMIELVCG